jgi:hypothetical protein
VAESKRTNDITGREETELEKCLKDWIDRLSRNVGRNYYYPLRNNPEERSFQMWDEIGFQIRSDSSKTQLNVGRK